MKREQVYHLIDAERNYQNRKWKDVSRTQSDTETPVAAWLIYIETHLELAKDEIYCLDEKAALEHIRKITALGVACMEHNETKGREVEPEPFIPCFRPCGSGIGPCKECAVRETCSDETEDNQILWYAEALGFNHPQELLDKLATWDEDMNSCTWVFNQLRKRYDKITLEAVTALVKLSRQRERERRISKGKK